MVSVVLGLWERQEVELEVADFKMMIISWGIARIRIGYIRGTVHLWMLISLCEDANDMITWTQRIRCGPVETV